MKIIILMGLLISMAGTVHAKTSVKDMKFGEEYTLDEDERFILHCFDPRIGQIVIENRDEIVTPRILDGRTLKVLGTEQMSVPFGTELYTARLSQPELFGTDCFLVIGRGTSLYGNLGSLDAPLTLKSAK